MKLGRVMLTVVSTVVLLTGCTKFTMMTRDRSTVYIKENGKVSGIFFEEFKQDYYDEKELEEYIETEVSDQNARAGKGSVKINYFSVKNDLAKVGLEFAGVEDYNTFNGCNIVTDTYEDMRDQLQEEGMITFYDTQGKRMKQQEMELEDTKAVLIDENIQVKVDGEILYVTKNVTMHEKNKDEAIVPGNGYSCIIYK